MVASSQKAQSHDVPTAVENELNQQLMKAASKCNLEKVKLLLEAGASASFMLENRDEFMFEQEGPLHSILLARAYRLRFPRQAAQPYWLNLDDWKAVVQLLIKNKADVNSVYAVDGWCLESTHLTAFEIALPFALADHSFLELFLSAGADANARQSLRRRGQFLSEQYVLHKAIRGGKLEAVRALLDAGADVDAVESEATTRGFNRNSQVTGLHIACSAGNLPLVALLLARSADVNAVATNLHQAPSGRESRTDPPGIPVKETALHQAIIAKRAALVTMLVCAGADRDAQRVRESVSSSCIELCGDDDDLLKALQAEWTPETHKLFPREVQRNVEAVLLVAKRQKWPIPRPVLSKIFNFLFGPSRI